MLSRIPVLQRLAGELQAAVLPVHCLSEQGT